MKNQRVSYQKHKSKLVFISFKSIYRETTTIIVTPTSDGSDSQNNVDEALNIFGTEMFD
jgi:hypothetical protein